LGHEFGPLPPAPMSTATGAEAIPFAITRSSEDPVAIPAGSVKWVQDDACGAIERFVMPDVRA
jgi:hypothetical protein